MLFKRDLPGNEAPYCVILTNNSNRVQVFINLFGIGHGSKGEEIQHQNQTTLHELQTCVTLKHYLKLNMVKLVLNKCFLTR